MHARAHDTWNLPADAFKSRAEIYKMRGETILAISNYTQAVNCNPDDAESFFRRAKMYEKTNETLLAMDDYAKVSPLLNTTNRSHVGAQ